MTTVGQFNSKSPTIKRILKEASELASNPSPDFHASPLDTNLFEWHFTLRGPPAPSPYATGIYHGRIVLPNTYPLRPPSFRFMTPSGRFEVNREICLSISGHHEETWQPAWGIRTALVALRSFMDTEAKGQVGGLECEVGARRDMAGRSRKWKCAVCGSSNEEIIEGQDLGENSENAKEEAVPDELRLAYREDLSTKSSKTATSATPTSSTSQEEPAPQGTRQRTAVTTRRRARRSQDAWLDKTIYAIAVLLAFLVARKLLSFIR